MLEHAILLRESAGERGHDLIDESGIPIVDVRGIANDHAARNPHPTA